MRTGLFGALLMVAGLASAGEGGWVDAHLHYVDFMQQSDGSEAMLAAMDEAGVEDAWLFGLPVVKKWQGSMAGCILPPDGFLHNRP